jgi:transposase
MTRRKYTREFKEQAVKLTYTSRKSVQEIAGDLGINANMLNRWRREDQVSGGGRVAFSGNGHARDEELLNLRKALKQAEIERDILKKTVVLFAQPTK